MNELCTAHQCVMKNGTPYQVQQCIEPGTEHSAQFLRGQIVEGLAELSLESRWHRFANPIHKLTGDQLDILVDLDGKDKVAWCASIMKNGREKGIGLARYIRYTQEPDIAEFAITVLDVYQDQGIGFTLLKMLIESAKENNLSILRGFIVPSNKRMLSLCRHFDTQLHSEDSGFIVADINVKSHKDG